jgi:hypothetical protein
MIWQRHFSANRPAVNHSIKVAEFTIPVERIMTFRTARIRSPLAPVKSLGAEKKRSSSPRAQKSAKFVRIAGGMIIHGVYYKCFKHYVCERLCEKCLRLGLSRLPCRCATGTMWHLLLKNLDRQDFCEKPSRQFSIRGRQDFSRKMSKRRRSTSEKVNLPFLPHFSIRHGP